MSFDRKEYNKAIEAAEVATNELKYRRSLYIKEIRTLGVELRKKLCQKSGLCCWINPTFEKNDSNPNEYGVDVCFEGNDPLAVSAIVLYMEENGWSNVKLFHTTTYCSRIRAY